MRGQQHDLVALGRLQGRHHVRRGHEERTGEVVRLHALTQELRVVGGFGMAEDPTRQRLQHRGPRVGRGGCRAVAPAEQPWFDGLSWGRHEDGRDWPHWRDGRSEISRIAAVSAAE